MPYPDDFSPSPTYQPASRRITAITNSYPALITTSFDHDYYTGLIVRLHIPKGFGMPKTDSLFGPITVTGPTTFTMDIDTTNMDAFVVPVLWPDSYQFAQAIPIGEINNELGQATQNVLTY